MNVWFGLLLSSPQPQEPPPSFLVAFLPVPPAATTTTTTAAIRSDPTVAAAGCCGRQGETYTGHVVEMGLDVRDPLGPDRRRVVGLLIAVNHPVHLVEKEQKANTK